MNVAEKRAKLGLITVKESAELAGSTPEGIARAIAFGKLRSTTIASQVWVQRESLADVILVGGSDALHFPLDVRDGWLASLTIIARQRGYTLIRFPALRSGCIHAPTAHSAATIHESPCLTAFRRLLSRASPPAVVPT